jgi:hypothetical protein
MVWFFLSHRTLTERVTGIAPLLNTWGGEGIYMSAAARPFRSHLRTLGRPAVVVVDVHVRVDDYLHPPLSRVFVAKTLGVAGADASLSLRSRVPGHQVVAIWQPGDEAYERHVRLR